MVEMLVVAILACHCYGIKNEGIGDNDLNGDGEETKTSVEITHTIKTGK